MSENKHTPGPWYASEEGGNWRAMAADENGGYTLADMCCNDQEANARRIVACVNACAGIPTGALEDMVTPIRQHLNSADIHAAKLVKQRDELLAALDITLAQHDALLRDFGLCSADTIEQARAVLASVKGEQ